MGRNTGHGKHGIWAGLKVLVGLGLISFASCTVSAQPGMRGRGAEIGTETNFLQLTILQKTPGRLFSVELHNVGSQALVLNLGMMLANGRKQYADRIRLQLTEPNEKLFHLKMIGPGFIGGRIDPMDVPLPSGATFTLLIDLEQYYALEEEKWKLILSPGNYTLRAKYTGIAVSQRAANLDLLGIRLMPFWTGGVQSNVLPFTVK